VQSLSIGSREVRSAELCTLIYATRPPDRHTQEIPFLAKTPSANFTAVRSKRVRLDWIGLDWIGLDWIAAGVGLGERIFHFGGLWIKVDES
jgi:hypothetical protein